MTRSAYHMRPLPRCPTCGKPATDEIRNSYNAELGVYCHRHALARIRELRDLEAKHR